jgi:hypothetical protein
MNASEIDLSRDLDLQTKIKICKALIQSKVDAGESGLDWLQKALSNPMLSSDQDIQKFITPLGATVTIPPSSGDLKQRDACIENAIAECMQQAAHIDPRPMFEPIHAIAQGMKANCFPKNRSSIQSQNDCWTRHISKTPYQTFSDKVQGTRMTENTRAMIVENIRIDPSCNEKINNNVRTLKSWISDSQTTYEDIRLFLKFTTGSTSVLPGQYISISSSSSSTVIVPFANTCSNKLTFSSQYPKQILDLPETDREQRFLQLMIQEMTRTVNLFDSV